MEPQRPVSSHDHPALRQRNSQVYRVTLRSDDVSLGDATDATFVINWGQEMDKDSTYMVQLESFLVQEQDPTSYADQILSVEMDQVFPNVYDSRLGRNATTLATFKGLSYTGTPHLAGCQLSTPTWQNTNITLRVRTTSGLASELASTGAKWVATLLYYPSN